MGTSSSGRSPGEWSPPLHRRAALHLWYCVRARSPRTVGAPQRHRVRRSIGISGLLLRLPARAGAPFFVTWPRTLVVLTVTSEKWRSPTASAQPKAHIAVEARSTLTPRWWRPRRSGSAAMLGPHHRLSDARRVEENSRAPSLPQRGTAPWAECVRSAFDAHLVLPPRR